MNNFSGNSLKTPKINTPVAEYLESEQFFVPNLTTRLSTIMIHAGERTILVLDRQSIKPILGIKERIYG